MVLAYTPELLSLIIPVITTITVPLKTCVRNIMLASLRDLATIGESSAIANLPIRSTECFSGSAGMRSPPRIDRWGRLGACLRKTFSRSKQHRLAVALETYRLLFIGE